MHFLGSPEFKGPIGHQSTQVQLPFGLGERGERGKSLRSIPASSTHNLGPSLKGCQKPKASASVPHQSWGKKITVPGKEISVTPKRKLSGESYAENLLPSSRPRALRATKASVGFNAGDSNKKPQVTSASVSPPTPGMIRGGRNGWGLPHIQAGRAPLPPCRSSWPSQTECPSQPHSGPLSGWGWASAQAQGTSWLSAHPGRCPHGKKCKHPPTPCLGSAQGGPGAYE